MNSLIQKTLLKTSDIQNFSSLTAQPELIIQNFSYLSQPNFHIPGILSHFPHPDFFTLNHNGLK